MPPKKAGKFVELDAELLASFQAMCERNGTTFRFELEDAMRRHLAYPPARKPEPLPDAAPVEPPPKPKKGRGKKA